MINKPAPFTIFRKPQDRQRIKKILHIKIEIIDPCFYPRFIMPFFCNGEHRGYRFIGCDNGKPFVIFKIENIGQRISLPIN